MDTQALPVKAANNFENWSGVRSSIKSISEKNKIKASISELKNQKYDTGSHASLP